MMKVCLNKTIITIALLLILSFGVLLTLTPSFVFAQTTTSQDSLGYTPLAPLYEGQGEDANLASYLNNLFRVLLGIATVLAVIMIVVAGIQYATSASEGGKSAAKTRIWNAVWGLILAMASWLILSTINPALLNFNLELESITGVGVAEKPTEPAEPSGCDNCVTVPSGIPIKPGACSGSEACKVDASLAARLETLNSRLEQQGIDWRITEAWPPTVNHQNACHQNGTCVDANFTGGSNIASNVRHFVDAASDAGLTACYEVRTQGDRDRLVNEFGAPPGNVKVIPDDPNTGKPRITGNHFSVYNRTTSCN